MLEIKILCFNDLSDTEKECVPNNGHGKEYSNYLKIIHNNEIISIESDAMEPEDATFGRDLNWIADMLQRCYDLGVEDTTKERIDG